MSEQKTIRAKMIEWYELDAKKKLTQSLDRIAGCLITLIVLPVLILVLFVIGLHGAAFVGYKLLGNVKSTYHFDKAKNSWEKFKEGVKLIIPSILFPADLIVITITGIYLSTAYVINGLKICANGIKKLFLSKHTDTAEVSLLKQDSNTQDQEKPLEPSSQNRDDNASTSPQDSNDEKLTISATGSATPSLSKKNSNSSVTSSQSLFHTPILRPVPSSESISSLEEYTDPLESFVQSVNDFRAQRTSQK